MANLTQPQGSDAMLAAVMAELKQGAEESMRRQIEEYARELAGRVAAEMFAQFTDIVTIRTRNAHIEDRVVFEIVFERKKDG
jgi:flagellar motor switch protein FliG